MDQFWKSFGAWDHIGQGFFLLVVLGALLVAVRSLAYFAAVLFRGWPPEHCTERIFEEDPEE